MPVIAGFNRQIPTEILNVEVVQPPCLSLLLESFKFPLKQFFFDATARGGHSRVTFRLSPSSSFKMFKIVLFL